MIATSQSCTFSSVLDLCCFLVLVFKFYQSCISIPIPLYIYISFSDLVHVVMINTNITIQISNSAIFRSSIMYSWLFFGFLLLFMCQCYCISNIMSLAQEKVWYDFGQWLKFLQSLAQGLIIICCIAPHVWMWPSGWNGWTASHWKKLRLL